MANSVRGNMTDDLALIATIDPVSQGAGSVNTTVIDMRYWREVVFYVSCGVLGTNATVDFLVKGDTASGGSYATTITGKSITQLVKASNDGSKAEVRVTAEEVAAQGFRYIRGTLTVGTAASLVTVLAIAAHARYSDAPDYDLASVVQIVT